MVTVLIANEDSTTTQHGDTRHIGRHYGDVLYHRAFGLNMRSNCHYSYTEPPIKKLASQRLKRVILYIWIIFLTLHNYP